MKNLDQLKKELNNNFIYELQNIPTALGEPTSYFTNEEIEEALKSGNNVTYHGEPSHSAQLVFATIRLLKRVCKDIENNEDRVKLLSERKASNFEELIEDYQIILKEHSGNYPSLPIQIPETKDDEVLIARVGTEDRPASSEDIQEVQMVLAAMKANPDLIMVTHHAIDFVVLKRKDLNKMETTRHDEK